MSSRAPLYSSSSVSSYPSNWVQASWNTVGAPQLGSAPTVAQSQALRRTVPSCPTTPLMSERKTATGTPATSQPSFPKTASMSARKVATGTPATSQPSCPNTPSMSARKIATGTPGTPATSQPASVMCMGTNASTGAKYSSMPSVSTSTAINRASAPTAKLLSGGVNFGAQSSTTLPATKPSGRATPSTPVLRTVTPPRVDRFVAKPAQADAVTPPRVHRSLAKPAQAEASRVAQQTGMAPTPTDKPDQSAQRNDKALKPAEIEPPMGDEAAKAKETAETEAAAKAAEEARAKEEAAKAKEAAEAEAAAKAAGEARAAAEAAKAKEAAEAEAAAKAAEEARTAEEKAKEATEVEAAAKAAEEARAAEEAAKATTMASTPQRKSETRRLLGKLLGRTFSCIDDPAGDCQAVTVKDSPQVSDVPAMGA